MSANVKTEEQILQDMLNNISNIYEKSVGYLTYDITKTNAIELAKVYQYALSIANLRLVKDLSGDDLTARVYDNKGTVRKVATKAKVVLALEGTGKIQKGDLFSTANNIQFISLETKPITEIGSILAECTQSGVIGMVGANSITQIPITLPGFTEVTNPNASYDGFEEETDEALKQRYYDALRNPITSNNQAHFIYWAKSVTGVGNAKVIPLWNGDLTVKVIIIDSNMQPASADLVNTVQEYIDPKGEYDSNTNTWSLWGTGTGQSAIGNYCSVVSAIAKNIDIACSISKDNGYSDEEIKANISNKITEYLKEIAFSTIVNYVSNAKVISLILSANGVLDVQNVKVNGSINNNVIIGEEEVAVMGTVTLL
ncbi:baseplate J/gp47 family protein [Clostridium brassicae]|uniref:Baseplate J/gp47 family protein n=1 Tax=Clostridium brassicae TaxID=2999072 RepID=A0ABT4D6Q0_9CLOT|nr:baseplate J/gp47 family protein [Clostridium brassicae]MCY6957967.1 baseplate J/gp47 family protein [Clostridium brassicae]